MANYLTLGKTFGQEIIYKKRETKRPGIISVALAVIFSFLVVLVTAFIFNYFAVYFQGYATLAATEVDPQQVTKMINEGYIKVNDVDCAAVVNHALGDDFQPANRGQPEKITAYQTEGSVSGQNFLNQPYKTRRVAQSYPVINITPGKGITFWVDFENTGTETWKNSSDHFVALNVANPTGRQSLFRHPYWLKPYRPTRLSQSQVKPGETGRFRFALQASAVEGFYRECFALVAENLTFISGGDFCINIKVGNPVPDYQAKKIRQSEELLIFTTGETKDFWVDFENQGKATWKKTGQNFIALNVTNPTGRHSTFQDSSWTDYYYRPAKLNQAQIKRGEVGRFSFRLKAPAAAGRYIECFGLVAENLTWITGGDFCLEIQVQAEGAEVSSLGPDLRVGLFITEGLLELTASTDFQILTSENELVSNFPAGQEVSFNYQGSNYQVYYQNQRLYQGTEYLRLVPNDDGIITLLNYSEAQDSDEELGDNQFRGKIELHYALETKKLWVINELPMEYYLRGLAETGNTAPTEYQKALIIAARTYALYHYNQGTKHAEDNFHVDDQYDQVYWGYRFELRTLRLTEAVIATTGQIVTYNSELAITPYFSHSDGRTRAWEEVWSGGPYPWMVSVPDPHCEGMDLLGHGVGMSALGAYLMADEEGATYEQILKHYYTGIEIKKIY